MGVYQCQNPKCKEDFTAREADRARGWARFCSKTCKAVAQQMNGGSLPRKKKHQNAHKSRMTRIRKNMTPMQRLEAAAWGHARAQGVDLKTWLSYRIACGGMPQFDRRGEYVGFTSRFDDAVLEHDVFEDLAKHLGVDPADDFDGVE